MELELEDCDAVTTTTSPSLGPSPNSPPIAGPSRRRLHSLAVLSGLTLLLLAINSWTDLDDSPTESMEPAAALSAGEHHSAISAPPLPSLSVGAEGIVPPPPPPGAVSNGGGGPGPPPPSSMSPDLAYGGHQAIDGAAANHPAAASAHVEIAPKTVRAPAKNGTSSGGAGAKDC
mmetsp:Transcript_42900/g.130549  ORF Transcript_42900/g.130549 Transcript_42900/m.130549 type:complete len:174 (-) Transcript_42900:221-742(-)